MEIATGYSVFANGGYKIEPFLIQRIENFNDGVIFQATPLVVCEACPPPSEEPAPTMESVELITSGSAAPEVNATPETGQQTPLVLSENLLTEIGLNTAPSVRPAPRVIDETTAYIMNSILRSVITEGSGRPANRAIPRQDLAGKTGTTNDAADLWFSGYNGELVTTVFVGFDQPSSLGRSEQAATVALPIWIDYMKEVLEGTPESVMPQPDGLVTVRINQQTGLRARADEQGAIFETFRAEEVPEYGNDDDDGSGLRILGDEGEHGRIF
jgi:penicillin-binding protein 1A